MLHPADATRSPPRPDNGSRFARESACRQEHDRATQEVMCTVEPPDVPVVIVLVSAATGCGQGSTPGKSLCRTAPTSLQCPPSTGYLPGGPALRTTVPPGVSARVSPESVKIRMLTSLRRAHIRSASLVMLLLGSMASSAGAGQTGTTDVVPMAGASPWRPGVSARLAIPASWREVALERASARPLQLAAPPKRSRRWVWIVLGVGGGAAVAALAMRGGETRPPEPVGTVTIGPPSVGAPQ